MRKLLIGLLFIAACGSDPAEDPDDHQHVPHCLDLLAVCEFQANRSGSIFAQAGRLFDCGADYGLCVGKRSDDVDCEDECSLTYFGSVCLDACSAQQRRMQADTSTSS